MRLTRSHIHTVQASLNPLHAQTSRPVLLLLQLLSIPGKTTNIASPPPKATPSASLNCLVNILPRTSERAEVVIGYTDGKVETISIGAKTAEQLAEKSSKMTGLKYQKNKRRAEEAMSIGELVEKVDAWARFLKAKDEGMA